MLRASAAAPFLYSAQTVEFTYRCRAYTQTWAAYDVIPEQWRDGFSHTAPVPVQLAGSATAFSWLKRQHPDAPLAFLGKLFRQNQVRILQQGKVKRIPKSRSLQAGDILLIPVQTPVDDNVSAAQAWQRQRRQQQPQHWQLRRQQPHHDIQQQVSHPPASASASDSRLQHYQQQQHSPQWAATTFRLSADEMPQQQQQSPCLAKHQQHQQQQQTPQSTATALLSAKTLQQQQQLPPSASQPQQQQQQQQQQQLDSEQQLVLAKQWAKEELIDPWAAVPYDPWGPKHHHQQQQQQQQELQALEQPQQHQEAKALTVHQVHKWLLASSADVAVLFKPPGVSFYVAPGSKDSYTLNPPDASSSSSSSDKRRQLHPVLAAALHITPPEAPQVVSDLDDSASGAVVLSRHSAAHEWLTAWAAGEPAAVAAATVALQGGSAAAASGANRHLARNNKRVQQQQRKLERLAAAAAAQAAAAGDASGGSAAGRAEGFSAKELAGLQQLFTAVGGLRMRRIFWAVVQGQLPLKQTGTLKNRLLHGQLSLQALTRYKVLASSRGLTWLELQPLTNRRNQMRIHCAKTLRAPIVGDYRYGYRPSAHTMAAATWRQGHQTLAKSQLGVSTAAAWGHQKPDGTRQQAMADADDDEGTPEAMGSAALLLHCREVVLLRPRKPPVHVVAPLPRQWRQLLHSMGWG